MQQRMMPRIVMRSDLAARCPGVHGISLDGSPARPTSAGMSRETMNLICAELPGAEKLSGAEDRDIWAAAGEPFARAGPVIEVRLDSGWVPLPQGVPEREARERIVEAYERLRHLLPAEDQPRLDRTSG